MKKPHPVPNDIEELDPKDEDGAILLAETGWGRSFRARKEHFFIPASMKSACGTASQWNVAGDLVQDAPKQGGCPKCLRLAPKKRSE